MERGQSFYFPLATCSVIYTLTSKVYNRNTPTADVFTQSIHISPYVDFLFRCIIRYEVSQTIMKAIQPYQFINPDEFYMSLLQVLRNRVS